MSKIVNKTQLNYFATGLYAKIKENFDAMGSAATAESNAKTYADGLNSAMDSKVNSLGSEVAVLKGDANTEGSVAYQIAQVVAGADASFDTLKEIADWITNDTTGATKMANDIVANSEAIADLEALVGEIPSDATATDIVGYIQEYVEAQLNGADLSQYAKAVDLGAVEIRVTTAEGKITTLEGDVAQAKTDIATNTVAIDKAKLDAKAYADQAEANAKTYADSLAVNYATAAQGAKADANTEAIGTESDSETGAEATGIYARLEALEVAVTNEEIDEIINGLE